MLGDAQPVEVLVAQPEHHELLSPLAADVDAHMRVRPFVARVGALTGCSWRSFLPAPCPRPQFVISEQWWHRGPLDAGAAEH